jgi:hypothetical protein
MKKPARFLSICCATVGAAAAQVAAAAEQGLYVGGHFGQSSKDADRSFYDLFNDDIQAFSFFEPIEETVSFDDSDSAFGLVIGYRLTPHLAFEAGYSNFGEVRYRSSSTGNFPLEAGSETVIIKTETTGFTLAVLGVLPLSRDWELFGRVGALFANNQLSIAILGEGQQFLPPLGNRLTASDSQDSTDVYAGVGLSRRFFEIYDLRLEYHRALDAGDESFGGKGDLDVALLGLVVTF